MTVILRKVGRTMGGFDHRARRHQPQAHHGQQADISRRGRSPLTDSGEQRESVMHSDCCDYGL
jgi:hypothetical protein